MSNDFETEIKQAFLEEATQLLTDAEQCFLELEKSPSDKSLLEKIFRLAHNLKGSSRAVGFDSLGTFTHTVESCLLKLKNGEMSATPTIVSLLLKCNDRLKQSVDALKTDVQASLDFSDLLTELTAVIESKVETALPASPPQQVEESNAPSETITEAPLVDAQLDAPPSAVLTETPLLSTPATSGATFSEPATPEVSAPKKKPNSQQTQPDETVRVSLRRLDRLVNLVGEMVILESMVENRGGIQQSAEFAKVMGQLTKVTKEVQDLSMSLRTLPLKPVFQRLQRTVRDTAQVLGKPIQLMTAGEDLEVDKSVLEGLGDPLVHLLRNACDHGIEPPEKRKESGKSETGTIWLIAKTENGRLVIEVKDDGKGINPDVLRKKALERGIISSGKTLTDAQAIELIFHSGFSTKEQVTEVSGRGVGLDVVKTNIEALQGTIQLDSEVGKGSQFSLFLPLSLSIIEGLLVKSRQDLYMIPLAQVHESVRLSQDQVENRTGIGQVLELRGETIPVYDLSRLLGKSALPTQTPSLTDTKTDNIALICRTRSRSFAIQVDDIVKQQQVVIKSLGAELNTFRGLGGSAILGDGRPVLILELPNLVPNRVA